MLLTAVVLFLMFGVSLLIKTPDQEKTKAGTKPEKDGTLDIEIKRLYGGFTLISEYSIFNNIILIFIRFLQKDEKAIIIH